MDEVAAVAVGRAVVAQGVSAKKQLGAAAAANAGRAKQVAHFIAADAVKVARAKEVWDAVAPFVADGPAYHHYCAAFAVV